MKDYITITGNNAEPIVIPVNRNGDIAVLDLPMMSDYKWQLLALMDRINNPSKYAAIENVTETIARLMVWFEDHYKG